MKEAYFLNSLATISRTITIADAHPNSNRDVQTATWDNILDLKLVSYSVFINKIKVRYKIMAKLLQVTLVKCNLFSSVRKTYPTEVAALPCPADTVAYSGTILSTNHKSVCASRTVSIADH